MSKTIPRHVFENLEHGRDQKRARKREDNSSTPRKRERPSSRHPFPAQPLAAALKKALAAPVIKRRMEALDIMLAWEELVDSEFSRHVQPVSLDKGILTLETDSSVWRFQAGLQKEQILQQISAELPHKTVTHLRIK